MSLLVLLTGSGSLVESITSSAVFPPTLYGARCSLYDSLTLSVFSTVTVGFGDVIGD